MWQKFPDARTFLYLMVTINRDDFLNLFFYVASISIEIYEKYAQNMLKSCVKNPGWSHFYSFYLLVLKLYMLQGIVLTFVLLYTNPCHLCLEKLLFSCGF